MGNHIATKKKLFYENKNHYDFLTNFFIIPHFVKLFTKRVKTFFF